MTNILNNQQSQCEQQSSLTMVKLNWTNILHDELVYHDSRCFKQWDGNINFQGQSLLQKDIVRTRTSQSHFLKQSTQRMLIRLTTFYCKFNHITYQQGLLEVIIPFALLHNKSFSTRKCYAYFNSFMRNCFPNLLTQKTINNRQQLPHLMIAIYLCKLLLNYHRFRLAQLLQSQQIPISMIATQQLMTVFAKGMPLKIVYLIYDYYINKKNKNYLLYMFIALLISRQDDILKMQQNNLQQFMNKKLKDNINQNQLSLWFQLTNQIGQNTPKSFEIKSKKVGFTEKTIQTQEQLLFMIKSQQHLIDFLMPIYYQEINKNKNQYHFMICMGKCPKQYKSIKLKLNAQLNKNIIVELQKIVNNIIIVIGITQQNKQIEIIYFRKIIKQLAKQDKYKHKFVILTQYLENNNDSICNII